MISASSLPYRTGPLGVLAMLVGGLAGIEPASAQPAGRDWAGWMQQRAQAHRASQRDHRDLEANGFRYVGTDGHSPYVYYVYRSADGREYHCAQGAWKTGPCFPNRRRDVRVLPGHVRIVDLKRAGFGYQGLRQGPRGIEHVYANARTGSVYACPNEGQASCRAVGQDSSARRAQARPRSVLD